VSKAIVAAAGRAARRGLRAPAPERAPDLFAASLCGFVTEVVDADAVVHTDGWQGYRHLRLLGHEHRRSSQRQPPAGEWLLPRVHRSISNLKAWLHGTHRDVPREHLQV
jgi:ISXO2 transposase-like protein